MTQAVLAERVGAPASVIALYESGRREPRVRVAVRIAEALETTVAMIWPPEGRPIKLHSELPAQGQHPAQNSGSPSSGQVPDDHEGGR